MTWTTESTLFSWPVFIVWKIIYEGLKKIPVCKGQIVVNIWELNKILLEDSYSLSLQDNIIVTLQGCLYISTMNELSFFHQFLVCMTNQHKFIIVSHCGQKQLNVVIMRFKNSSPHVQCIMNTILQPHKKFTHCYVDNIVMFSKTLNDHIQHLCTIFELFQKKGLSMKSVKFYISYLSVTLLGQRVDRFSLTTADKKIAALKRLKFSENLHKLKIYLELISYLRGQISYYTQCQKKLQKLKTESLKRSLLKRNKQRQFMTSKQLTLTPLQ